MSRSPLAPLRAWLTAPLAHEVALAIERLRRAPDVQRVAVMPDVHLAADVCVGVVVATSQLIYPQAVGGDIGCGVLAVAFDCAATALAEARTAARVLAALARALPARRRNRAALVAQPPDLHAMKLSAAPLEALRRSVGAIEFATLGSGNHFMELQADEGGRLWLMVHSGSRAIGPAVRDHHLEGAQRVGEGLRALDGVSPSGRAYLHDLAYARRFAAASRAAMAAEAATAVGPILGARLCWDTAISTDHNHVSRERHADQDLWVHRKGAMPAPLDASGVLPGSMGTASYHVRGRGHGDSLCSSAHGAGRALSRTAARAAISEHDLRRQMQAVWYDFRLAGKLRDEAPGAYKDVTAVLRAQRELVRVTRVLRPVLNHKGL